MLRCKSARFANPQGCDGTSEASEPIGIAMRLLARLCSSIPSLSLLVSYTLLAIAYAIGEGQ